MGVLLSLEGAVLSAAIFTVVSAPDWTILRLPRSVALGYSTLATGKECYGTSVIVGPTGDPLVVLPTDREVFGVATLNLALNADWDRWRSRLDPMLPSVSGRDRPREP